MKKRFFEKGFPPDISGAFGDKETFILLALGMIIIFGFSHTLVFLLAVVLYIIAGLYCKIPMLVQPMKVVVGQSILNGIRPKIVSTSAYIMAGLMLTFLLFDFSKLHLQLHNL
ncbi:MAG: hypothetical protein ACUVUG_04925 [Candidatus Aminicenantia bacterium]